MKTKVIFGLGFLFLITLSLTTTSVLALNPDRQYEDSLKAYWRFEDQTFRGDELPELKTVIDDTNNNNTGILQNGAELTSKGKIGEGLRLDGENDFLEIDDDKSLKELEKFSILAWIKTKELGDLFSIMSKGADDGITDEGWILQQTVSGHIIFWIYTSSWKSVASPNPIEVDEWIHVCGVYTGSELLIYIDGSKVKENSITGTFTDSDLDLWVGAFETGDPIDKQYFNGSMDEIAIYNEVLTDDEIKDIYDNGIPFEAPTEEFDLMFFLIQMGIIAGAVVGVVIGVVLIRRKSVSKGRKTSSPRKKSKQAKKPKD